MATARVTQGEIAKSVGVSQAAVSYVLGGKGAQVSAEVKEQILRASRRLGYFDQKRRRSGVQKLAAYLLTPRENMNDDYQVRLLQGIQEGLTASGYLMVHHICASISDLDPLASLVMGGILGTAGDETLLQEARKLMPTVVVNDHADLAGVDVVAPDNADGIRQLMTHLHEHGHRRFAFFGIRDFHGPHAERYEAFLRMHERLALPRPNKRWLFTPRRALGTVEEMNQLIREAMVRMAGLDPRPTALVCPADTYAAEFVRISRECGIRVPQDLSIAGFDNLATCLQLSPTLSSVAQPLEAMGREAARLLLARIEHPKLPARHVNLSVEWIPRGSTGVAPAE